MLRKLNEWIYPDRLNQLEIINGVPQLQPQPFSFSIVTNYTSGDSSIHVRNNNRIFVYPFTYPAGERSNVNGSDLSTKKVLVQFCGVSSFTQSIGPEMDGISIESETGRNEMFVTVHNVDTTR